jgi:hypothetical protein
MYAHSKTKSISKKEYQCHERQERLRNSFWLIETTEILQQTVTCDTS